MIERYYHEGDGYDPFLIREGWQVAQLNYQVMNGFDSIDKVEAHRETDEVFVLVKGRAILIAANLMGGTFECQRMETGVTYNIPAGTWHNIALDKDAELIIVERSDTHKRDCAYMNLDQEFRARLRDMINSRLG